MTNKTIVKKKNRLFKIETINLNIFSDTYKNDYIGINFIVVDDDDFVLVEENFYNINYDLFDLLHDTDPSKIKRFKIESNHAETLIKSGIIANPMIDIIAEDFKNSGIAVLNLYEVIFNLNYIDNDKWERFVHALAIKEQVLINDKEDFNFENYGIVDYERCFNKNSEFNFEYMQRQTEFLSSHSDMASNSYTYESNNTKELIINFLFNFFRHNQSKSIKKCEHCDKWFIPDKKTTKYCDRMSPDYKNKNCKGAAVLIRKRLNEQANPIKYLRKRVRMKYYNPVNNYGREKDIEKLEKFDTDDKIWRDKLQNNEVTFSQYEEWLNSHFVRNRGKGVK